MPSRKILVILIICLGVVGAVWILQWNFGGQTPAQEAIGRNSPADLTASETGTTTESGINWQNILGTVQSTTTVASGLADSAGAPDDTTETAQLAKDFMARYLLAQGQANQSGVDTTNGLDTDTSDQIASDVLSSGSYTTNQAVVYTAQNLNIQADSSKATVENYILALVKNSNQMEMSEKQNGNEVDIINDAILNQDQNELAKLDPIIANYQTLLQNMLKVPTPEEATALQLGLVNSISVVLSDLQAVRGSFVDPVKSLTALSSYKQDYTNMGLAIQNLETYSQTKMKSFTN
jgi:hypothetical protein